MKLHWRQWEERSLQNSLQVMAIFFATATVTTGCSTHVVVLRPKICVSIIGTAFEVGCWANILSLGMMISNDKIMMIRLISHELADGDPVLPNPDAKHKNPSGFDARCNVEPVKRAPSSWERMSRHRCQPWSKSTATRGGVKIKNHRIN